MQRNAPFIDAEGCMVLLLHPSADAVATATSKRRGQCVCAHLCAERTGTPLLGEHLAVVLSYVPLDLRPTYLRLSVETSRLFYAGRFDVRFEWCAVFVKKPDVHRSTSVCVEIGPLGTVVDKWFGPLALHLSVQAQPAAPRHPGSTDRGTWASMAAGQSV